MVWFVLTYQYMGCWNIPLHPYVGGEGGGGGRKRKEAVRGRTTDEAGVQRQAMEMV